MGKIFMNRRKPFIFFSLVVLSIAALSLSDGNAAQSNSNRSFSNLDAIRIADYTTFSRITLEISNKNFSCTLVPLTKKPPVLMVKLNGVQAGDFGKEYRKDTEAFEKITFSTDADSNLVLTVPLSENVDIEGVFFHVWTDIVTIDLPLKVSNHKFVPDIEQIKKHKDPKEPGSSRKKVIVIDPGHGGLDPGAIGKHHVTVKDRLLEKDLALDVARRLANYLNKDSKYLAFLTRYDDYLPAPFGAKGANRSEYIKESLYYRVQLAKEYCGDILVSIHLNSWWNQSVRGFEIIYFGDQYADAYAADEENPDIKALRAIADIDQKDSFIISSIIKDRILSDSKQLATSIVEEIKNVPGVQLRPRPIYPNRLIVTKQFLMPSVLVELGYLSNKYDHANVKKPETRQKMAASIYKAVDKFFFNPADIPLVAVSSKQQQVTPDPLPSIDRSRPLSTSLPAEHTVRSGETLTRIADRYGVTVNQIRNLNRRQIKRGITIYPGQKLQLPSTIQIQDKDDSNTVSPVAKKNIPSSGNTINYTVQKNDTLEKIAIDFDMSVDEIKSLNGKKSHLIYPGEELKVTPGREVVSARSMQYKVQRGDTLGKIAERFNVSLSRLKQANGLHSNLINVGQILRIP